ncbi:hypothetical protein [Streptomyces sp. NPDC060065]|uniref:hypothetical protein n=1 Tax=Streptomyces sp. NPDC060065 TaxID=3347050 RepID=UPI003696686D
MGKKPPRKPSQSRSVYDALGISPIYGHIGETVMQQLGIWDGVLKYQRQFFDSSPLSSAGFGLDPLKNGLFRDVLGPGPFGLDKSVAATLGLKLPVVGVFSPELFSVAIPATQGYNRLATAAGLDLTYTFGLKTGIADSLSFDLFDRVRTPLAPSVLQQAQELAKQLFPSNLQGFSDTEWAQLIDVATEDGIGLMWAPGTEHLRALLAERDREGRYAYLLRHQDELLDELSAGLEEVTEETLQDLVQLGVRSIECARAGLWEGALALATNVLYSATEEHAIEWYRKKFKGVRDHKNQPIQGMNGPGATVQFVLTNIPMPERQVGVFELNTHLVIRPMASTFKDSTLVRDQHNRHAVCHKTSYESFRKEYVLPAMLNMHALLRALDEEIDEDNGAE